MHFDCGCENEGTQERSVAKASKTRGLQACSCSEDVGSAMLTEDGVAMSDSVIPEKREVMLILPTSPVDFARFNEAIDCCGVRIGLDAWGEEG